ncbi:unnamed protein product [Prunus armeniaca]
MAAHTRERERERERSFMQSVRGWGGGMVMRWVLCGRRRLLRSYMLVADEKQRRLDYEKSIVCITKNQPRRPGRVWAALDWSGLR